MTDQLEGQMTIFDLDTSFGKTCLEPCQAPEKTTQEKTSRPSSRRSSASQNQLPMMCLCLKREDGPKPGISQEWEEMESPFPWLTKSTIVNGGAYHNAEGGLLWLPTSTDSQQQRFYLTLNIGEKPREEMPTKLSDILEENADPKYRLSSKACTGILNRAARRGKDLPKILKDALENQNSRTEE